MEYSPSAFVWTERLCDVAMFTTVMVAPLMEAEPGSSTVPRSLAVDCCASRVSTKAIVSKNERRISTSKQDQFALTLSQLDPDLLNLHGVGDTSRVE